MNRTKRTDALTGLADDAVLTDAERALLGVDQDRAAITDQLVALLSGQAAAGIERKASIAGVARTIRGVDLEKAFALNGNVEAVSCCAKRALAEVARKARIQDELDRRGAAEGLGRALWPFF